MDSAATDTRLFYVLKVKGKAKIPDYIQVRDAAFTLVGYFRPGHNNKTGRLADANQALFLAIERRAASLAYGEICKLEIANTDITTPA